MQPVMALEYERVARVRSYSRAILKNIRGWGKRLPCTSCQLRAYYPIMPDANQTLADEDGQRRFELPKERLVFMSIAAKDAQGSCLFSH